MLYGSEQLICDEVSNSSMIFVVAAIPLSPNLRALFHAVIVKPDPEPPVVSDDAHLALRQSAPVVPLAWQDWQH